jgi:hypothetical protein
MSVVYKCDECGRALPDATGMHSLQSQGLGQGRVLEYWFDVHVYIHRKERDYKRPDLCLPCLKELLAGATAR